MRKSHSTSTRLVATLVGLSLCWSVPLTSVQAGMLSTEQLATQHNSAQQRLEVRSLLARQDVANYLQAQGVNPADLQLRINALSDAEISQMHSQLDQLPAGEGFLGAVIAIIVIFMLLDIAGVTDIFPRI